MKKQKREKINMVMGWARRNRGTGVLNWAYLMLKYPRYRDHIWRLRKQPVKLLSLRNKLFVSEGK